MSRRLLHLTLGLSTTVALIAAGAAASASASTGDRALWEFSETSGSVAHDSSGNGNNGQNANVVEQGSDYAFNGHSSRIIVPNSSSLNPGSADFSFSVTFIIDALPASGEDYDMIRKGDGPGEYKIEVFNKGGQAKAYCVARDTAKHAALIWGTTNLNDGQQHTVTCSKTSTGASLKVDNLAPVTKTVSGGLGTFTNKNSLLLGAKKTGAGGDWFDGRMFEASVS